MTLTTVKEGRVIAVSPWHRGYDASKPSPERLPCNRSCVLVLYTGGTLGMKRGANGALAPVSGYFTEQIYNIDEVISQDMPIVDVVEFSQLLDSSCFTPSDWSRIAEDIGKLYHQYDGFVVIQGTDTMAYTASALSFMTENLGKSIILTGSQIPFSEVYNDARRNLILSLILAGSEDSPPEVCLFFSDRLLRGNRSVKVDSTGLQAFDSPNFPALATMGVNVNYRKDLALPPPRGSFRVHTRMDNHCIAMKLIPGYDDEALLSIVNHSTTLKAFVLLAYGTGNSSSRRESFLKFVEIAHERGILIVVLTQCLQGGVNLDTYEVGRAMQEMGVISGYDMTTEAAVTKLAYLFARPEKLSMSDVANAMSVPLRGELTPQLTSRGGLLQASRTRIIPGPRL